jgi:hypothetical protein
VNDDDDDSIHHLWHWPFVKSIFLIELEGRLLPYGKFFNTPIKLNQIMLSLVSE